MRRYAAWMIPLALGLSLFLGACGNKKAAEARIPVPTATPVPDKDVLGFTRGGSIWVMRYDGKDQRPLTRPGKGQSFWFPVPSPAGDHLIAWLSRADGTQDLVRVDLDGRVTVLTETGARAKSLMKNVRLGNAPSYSPDGKRIAYGFNGDLWIMDANGYNAETFVADGASWAPSFSPDGKRILYVNGNGDRFDVWMADIDSRETWQVTDFVDFTAGQPRWNNEGDAMVFTRSQGEDSDVILMALKEKDLAAPLTESDPETTDRLSGGAVWSGTGTQLLVSSARENGVTWNLYSMDARTYTAEGVTGTAAPNVLTAKQLTTDGAYSPFWLHPGSGTASVVSSAPSQPTPVVAKAATVVAAALTPPAPVATVAAAVTGKPPVQAQASPVAVATPSGKPAVAAAPVTPKAGVPAAKPTAIVAAQAVATPVPAVAAAPTQPPAKAAPLRLRLRASFNDDGSLAPAGLTELKKLSSRVAQYAGETVTIIGPQDRSPLKGKFAGDEARSVARAKAIAAELSKDAKLKPGVAKAQPYAPPAAGASGPPNSIQVYVELK